MMYDPTSFSYWEGCLQQQVLSFRVHTNSIVKPLLFLSFDKCVRNLQDDIYLSFKSVPTNLLNMLVNRALRYGINFSRLLRTLSGCNLTRLDVTNFGVGNQLPFLFFSDISTCYTLAYLDLYGFEFEVSELRQLQSLVNIEMICLGCDQKQYVLSEEVIAILSHFKLTSLHLRNFTIDMTSLSSFPRLVCLDLGCCQISDMSDTNHHPPPLTSISISKASIGEKFSLQALDFSLYASTLETLRISFLTLLPTDLFGSHIYTDLSELEIAYCSLIEYNWFRDLPQILHKYCPKLNKLIYLSNTNNKEIHNSSRVPPPYPNNVIESLPPDYISPDSQFSFKFISHHSSPPILMELILNHFHHPEVAEKLADLKNSSNTYFWSRGRMGSRARLSPHFLIIAYVIFLNPNRIAENTVLLERLRIDRYIVCDLEIICGEDYILPLLHYQKLHGAYQSEAALRSIQIAEVKGHLIKKKKKKIVSDFTDCL